MVPEPLMPADVLSALARHDTPTIANAIQSLGIRSATEGFTRSPVHAVIPGVSPAVGRVVTVTIRSDDPFDSAEAERAAMLPLYEAVAAVSGPKFVVVHDLDQGVGCLWGEVNATICHTMGAVGVITDGLVRDIHDVAALGIHYLARGIGVSRAYTRIVETGIPVDVGGVRFEPTDLVHADGHGAVLVPAEVAAEVVAAAERITAREQRLLDWVRSPEFDPVELPARRAQH